MRPIPWNKAFRKKDGTLVNMEDIGGGGSDLPEYSEADAGKVLGVDEEGLLEWGTLPTPEGTKVYVKQFTNIGFTKTFNFASFSSDTSASSKLYYYDRYGGTDNNLRIPGYTLISVKYAGSGVAIPSIIAIEPDYEFIGGVISDSSSRTQYTFNAYYVKNEDLETLT